MSSGDEREEGADMKIKDTSYRPFGQDHPGVGRGGPAGVLSERVVCFESRDDHRAGRDIREIEPLK